MVQNILQENSPFKFNADMTMTWRKVKIDNGKEFTIQDMIKIYCGELDYVKYDNLIYQGKILKKYNVR